MNVTDVIELTCAGDIGSDIGAYWDWMKTGDSSVDTMMKFLPLSHSNANEKITDVDGPCTNSRTTVLTYHITETDKNQGDLAFMCSANSTVPLPGGGTVYVSSSTFYIHVRKYPLFNFIVSLIRHSAQALKAIYYIKLEYSKTSMARTPLEL